MSDMTSTPLWPAVQVQVGATVYRARCHGCGQPLDVKDVVHVDAAVVVGTCTAEVTVEPCARCGEREASRLRLALAELIHAADPQTNVSNVRFYQALIVAKAVLNNGQGQEQAAPPPLPPSLYCAECGLKLPVVAEGFKAEPDGKTRVVPCARCTRRSTDKVTSALGDQLTALRAEIVGLRADIAKLRAEVGSIQRQEPVPTQPWWVPPMPQWPWYPPIITWSSATTQPGDSAPRGSAERDK